MKPRALVLIVLVAASCSRQRADSIEAVNEQLIAQCLAHPEFGSSSIDLHDPAKVQGWEQDFYEGAKSLHQAGSQPIEMLVEERKGSPPERVHCIDQILNTWPG
jgi:hypothetical protein